MQEFIALANSLADAAGEIAKAYFRTPFDVEQKGDNSPVTIADRAIEKKMREMIEAARPDDSIFGEEFGRKEGRSGYTWVLDPIDGTKSFVIGRATFGTLIALCKDGAPVLGVIDQPILKERWIGDGQQTTFNGAIAKTAPCGSLDSARIGSTTPAMFEAVGPVYKNFNEGRFFWGGDCYQYGLMACGFVDVIIEAGLQPYDYLALAPIVTGAGGVIADYEGRALTLSSDGCVIALGDPALSGEAFKLLKHRI
jgi:inositol-phosphate phosphatase/L-galactose 1-phosphate phosphatase/histidinol-phosphatase